MAQEFGPSASLATLKQRAHALRCVRQFFLDQGYWEVETPLLSQETCVDAWLDPFPVLTPQRRFLQTSPEFAMKRLLAAGADSIYQITRSFRADESGSRHNPEFTIIEWYRQEMSYQQQMEFTASLVRYVAQGSPRTLPGRIERWSYDEAFERAIGQRVLQLTVTELHALACDLFGTHERGYLPTGLENDRDGLLNILLATFVEPLLEEQQACFLYDFPASQAALAQVRDGIPPAAERFELYLGGLEICNGYQELTDAAELRRRINVQNSLRRAAGKDELPAESQLLRAMDAGFPSCSGVALGFDRLLMWLLDLPTIAEVQVFPWPRD